MNSSALMNVPQHPVMQTVDKEKIFQWIIELSNPETRENALLELSKKREVVPDLAPMLWNSFGTIAALLQEIINIYPAINPPTLTAHQSNRVCNALALLQCVASHPDTRTYFLAANIPLFLYPFLHTVSKTRPFEYLRLTSLGVIGALVKLFGYDLVTEDEDGFPQTRLWLNGRELPNPLAVLHRLTPALCDSAAERLRAARSEHPIFGTQSLNPCRS
ncbi:hypothetical protein V5799_030126 [Amblyomma americanum]|uniref:CCR4-NOT transcription complex subunit 9 n=1 Tax=Amblyomma americanum TaxID=6943 RepID=A0AAQ4EPB5_AMBAM